MSVLLEAAYDRCERITRDQARNFYYGIRLLPAGKRSALCALYALARRIDDIGDGTLPPQDKSRQLAELRRQLDDPAGSPDPVLAAVADVAEHFPVPVEAFAELVDGVEMDLAGRRYANFEELVDYCRCVAGSVGRLCLGVFSSRPDPRARHWADSLGIALQQANILRDVREDLLNGRVYLPQEDLDRFGVQLRLDSAGRLADPDGRLAELVRWSAGRAETWFDEGLRLVPLLDRRSAASCAAMAGIYRHLLRRIADEPTLILDRRLALSGRQKATVAVRALARGAA